MSATTNVSTALLLQVIHELNLLGSHEFAGALRSAIAQSYISSCTATDAVACAVCGQPIPPCEPRRLIDSKPHHMECA